jgi:hypothetical protein
MTNTLDSGKRRASLCARCCLRVVVAAAFALAQLLPPATLWATDFDGALPVSLDQPRINAALRRTPTGTPLTADFGGGVQSFNIAAFFDTGASGVLISEQTADFLEVQRLRWPTPGSELVEFEDVGVAGSDFFNVSEELYVSLAPFPGGDGIDDPGQHLTVYNQTFGPLRAQIGPLNAEPNPILDGLDIFGMPTMTGKVVVMDPKPADWNSNPNPDVMRSYVYNPGTPFNPATAATNPGIPPVDRSIALSYASFERFTSVSPEGAPGPSLRTNPFVGPNPLLALDPNPPPDATPAVRIGYGGQSAAGSWLFDTGAAASMISTSQAAKLHVRYRPGTEGTDNPRLETFDPANPSQPGTLIPDQFTLDIGGIGGTTKRSGFYLDSLLLPTIEGNPMNPDDPNHLRYLGAGVLVSDITLQDPNTQQSLTLDGILGMNLLVASASITPGPIPFPDAIQDGYFNWVVFDEPNKRFSVDLKDFVAPAPNEWLRPTSGDWGTAGNWSQGIAPNGNLQTALLGSQLGGNGTVHLQTTDRTVRVLRFNDDNASYTVASAGGRLILESASGPATIQFDVANTRSHEISAPIQIKSDLDVHATLDTLTLSGGQRWDPGRTVTLRTGTLRYNLVDDTDQVISDGNNTLVIDDGANVELAGTRAALAGSHSVLAVVTYVDVVNNSTNGLFVETGNHHAGAITGLGSTLVGGAGSLSAKVFRQASLAINAGGRAEMRPTGPGGQVSVLGSLSIAGTPNAPTATLDLTDSSAIINYTDTSPAATVRQQIIAGRGGAGIGKGWNGMGITSSAAAQVNANNPESRSVGYAENAAMPLGPLTTFRGQPVDTTSIIMAFTRTGDANLDGLVNDDDVTIVGASYAPGVPQASWALGDFDYNGFVDDDDVTLLGAFYDPSAPPLAAPAGASAVAAVPEPASAILLAVALLALGLAALRRSAR